MCDSLLDTGVSPSIKGLAKSGVGLGYFRWDIRELSIWLPLLPGRCGRFLMIVRRIVNSIEVAIFVWAFGEWTPSCSAG